MTGVVVQVTRRERAAARLRRELDKAAGRKTDPRVEAIADATVRPATVNGSASVGDVTVGADGVPADYKPGPDATAKPQPRTEQSATG